MQQIKEILKYVHLIYGKKRRRSSFGENQFNTFGRSNVDSYLIENENINFIQIIDTNMKAKTVKIRDYTYRT